MALFMVVFVCVSNIVEMVVETMVVLVCFCHLPIVVEVHDMVDMSISGEWPSECATEWFNFEQLLGGKKDDHVM